MKKLLFAFSALSFVQINANAQSIISIGIPLKDKGVKSSVKGFKQSQRMSSDAVIRMKDLVANDTIFSHLFSKLDQNGKEDTLRKVFDAIDAASSIDDVVKKMNEISPLKVLAVLGASNLEKIKEATGNGSIGLQYRIGKFKRVKKGPFTNWIDPHYIYVMYHAKTAISEDSTSMAKSFLFPEIGKRDFVLGYTFQLLDTNNFGIAPNVELGLNTFKDSANEHYFRSTSLTVGVKLSKSFPLPSLNTQAYLQFFPYYNLISVDPKYFPDFQRLLNEPNIHPTFHTFGMQTIVQIDNLILFCNMKYVTNKGELIENPDLKRFVYTIGTMLTL